MVRRSGRDFVVRQETWGIWWPGLLLYNSLQENLLVHVRTTVMPPKGASSNDIITIHGDFTCARFHCPMDQASSMWTFWGHTQTICRRQQASNSQTLQSSLSKDAMLKRAGRIPSPSLTFCFYWRRSGACMNGYWVYRPISTLPSLNPTNTCLLSLQSIAGCAPVAENHLKCLRPTRAVEPWTGGVPMGGDYVIAGIRLGRNYHNCHMYRGQDSGWTYTLGHESF